MNNNQLPQLISHNQQPATNEKHEQQTKAQRIHDKHQINKQQPTATIIEQQTTNHKQHTQ